MLISFQSVDKFSKADLNKKSLGTAVLTHFYCAFTNAYKILLRYPSEYASGRNIIVTFVVFVLIRFLLFIEKRLNYRFF